MRPNPYRFNAQFRQCGQNVTWARASLCPCRDAASGMAALSCPACDSRGVLWAPPIAAWAALSGLKVAREFAAYGMWQSGDVALTIGSDSPLYAAGEYDRIVMVQSTEPFSKILTRGSDTLGFPVACIDQCIWLDPTTQAVVAGGIPEISADGVPTWSTNPPPAGIQYTLRGRQNPEYFVFKDLPQDRAHFDGVALPRRILARKFDLFGRAGTVNSGT